MGLAMIGEAHPRPTGRDVDNPNKPIGVFMLCGPSGVGKTETALALAEALYGGEQNISSPMICPSFRRRIPFQL